MKKRALISVSDKTGIVEFATKLQQNFGYEIVATGGTYKLLKENSLEVIEITTITEFEDVLGGKVKTLHPKIHAAILANKTEAKAHKIDLFDMVIVNLYPFEQVAKNYVTVEELIKNIDIGGVAMLRAGAKSFENVSIVSNPTQYAQILDELDNNGQISLKTNEMLALEAFKTTTKYDGIIFSELNLNFNGKNDCPDFISLNFEKTKELRYGENPHQCAGIYTSGKIADYEILNGKELSYNNILDMSASVNIIAEFFDVACCAIVKHNTPCGVALGKDMEEAYLKAFDCDPISAFGGIIAFTQTVDENIAKHASSVFLEVLIAPDFTEKALDILKLKKNLRLIKLNTPLKEYKTFVQREFKITPFGTLVQNTDLQELDKDKFKVVTDKKPTQEIIEDMVFAWKVVKHVKSNAIVVAKDLKTLAICAGQTSRIDAVEIALNKACDSTKDAILASDGFFPATDNINAAAQARIGAIIQPGGSIKDNDVIAQCDKTGMIMITTGIRHFKH